MTARSGPEVRLGHGEPLLLDQLCLDAMVLIKWVGTHEEYDAIDVTKIGLPAPKEATKKAKKKDR